MLIETRTSPLAAYVWSGEGVLKRTPKGGDCSGGEGARIVGCGFRLDHVLADMVLDDFRDEAVERAAASGRLLQYPRAFGIRLDRALDRREQLEQPLEAVEQLLLFIGDMGHGIPLDTIPP